MLLEPSLPELLKNVDSRYLLVNVIARRARELSDASLRRGEPLTGKPVSIAAREIADGKIRATAELYSD
ncbi:MAG: DNA-directed RNA polymerase subunit omega [Oscillospiraceae bacterium]|jgi:DNA-directed RNA polymerase subunit omega|nr:DNA-directed RNA polymerase subunit omega [Oscillospiraceae bacterium]